MDDKQTETDAVTAKRKRGRPRIENILVFYRDKGGRVKAFNRVSSANGVLNTNGCGNDRIG